MSGYDCLLAVIDEVRGSVLGDYGILEGVVDGAFEGEAEVISLHRSKAHKTQKLYRARNFELNCIPRLVVHIPRAGVVLLKAVPNF
jgi:hypothetical protein